MRERMCALTRKRRPESELIRFVAAPDGTLLPDLKANLPGRGVWISAARVHVDQAVKEHCFARALHADVCTSGSLSDMVADQLRKSALGRAGLARKSGQIVCGYSKVEGQLMRQNAAAILIAADAARDSRRKMRATVRRSSQSGGSIPIYENFTSTELDLAFGRTNVIHAAVLPGAAGRSFQRAAERLARYETAGKNEGTIPEGDLAPVMGQLNE